ncbi:MAG: hypothetical protein C0507_10205 [Cyanobacteria bacterium PR.3.49]|nr:hypothetical protein [Cyanobacteria bacterium PR.3.49]
MAIDTQAPVHQPESAITHSAPSFPVESLAPTLQTGAATPTPETDALNRSTIKTAGLPPADDLFAGDWSHPVQKNDMQFSQKIEDRLPGMRNPFEQYEPREPAGLSRIQDLTAENQQKLRQLQDIARTIQDGGGNTAAVLKALQTHVDKEFGTNKDGSPKVSILAYRAADTTRETNFYATFNNSRLEQNQNRGALEASRKYGFTFPSHTVGWIDRSKSRGPVV